jgi:hypothetical protein
VGSPTYSVTHTPGDGTVPIDSAKNLPVDQSKLYYAANAEHGQMPSQANVRQQIVKILNSDSTVAAGIFRDAQCALNGKVILIASPVDIMITDQDGKYAGPTADDGTVINTIPNADYTILGEHKSVLLPFGQNQTHTILN